jgi:hypothetical protein
MIFSFSTLQNRKRSLGVALPTGCRHAVQIVAPVAAIVPILPLEKHHQQNKKSAPRVFRYQFHSTFALKS